MCSLGSTCKSISVSIQTPATLLETCSRSDLFWGCVKTLRQVVQRGPNAKVIIIVAQHSESRCLMMSICCIQSNSNASHFPRQEMAAFPQMFFLQEHYLPRGTSHSKDPSLGLSPLNKTVGKCKSLFFKNDWQYLRAHFVFWSLWQIPNLAACSACPTQSSCWHHVEIDRVAFCNLVMRLTTFTPIA